jgi:cytochrome c-type biogenesis protein CcmH
MIVFSLVALLIVVVALGVLFRPFIFKAKTTSVSHDQVNAEAHQYQLARLQADLSDGSLSSDNYEIAVRELEKRLLEETLDHVATCSFARPTRTILAICTLVPIAAVSLYVLLGDPSSLDGNETKNRTASKEVEQMVSGLVEKLKKDPNNPKGWAMLARSYKVMGRPVDAEKAYAAAEAYIANDAQLLADYADVVASNANGSFLGKPEKLIQQALAVDPNNAMALWLSGTAAFNSGRFNEAIKTWNYLLVQLDPTSEDARVLQSSIAEARAKGGAGPEASTALGASSLKPQAAVASHATISGEVALSAELKKSFTPNDVLMVIARKPGERMPIAVFRLEASAWPTKFKLDDSMSMNQQVQLSQQKVVELEARLSKSGQAKPAPGDLYSEPVKVTMGASNVPLRLTLVRP